MRPSFCTPRPARPFRRQGRDRSAGTRAAASPTRPRVREGRLWRSASPTANATAAPPVAAEPIDFVATRTTASTMPPETAGGHPLIGGPRSPDADAGRTISRNNQELALSRPSGSSVGVRAPARVGAGREARERVSAVARSAGRTARDAPALVSVGTEARIRPRAAPRLAVFSSTTYPSTAAPASRSSSLLRCSTSTRIRGRTGSTIRPPSTRRSWNRFSPGTRTPDRAAVRLVGDRLEGQSSLSSRARETASGAWRRRACERCSSRGS
jgi:hypothetical protein